MIHYNNIAPNGANNDGGPTAGVCVCLCVCALWLAWCVVCGVGWLLAVCWLAVW